jgi:hypothetical protein
MEMIALAYFFVGFIFAALSIGVTMTEDFREYYNHGMIDPWENRDTAIFSAWCLFLWPVVLWLTYKIHSQGG